MRIAIGQEFEARRAGEAWDNALGLVFTTELARLLHRRNVLRWFQDLLEADPELPVRNLMVDLMLSGPPPEALLSGTDGACGSGAMPNRVASSLLCTQTHNGHERQLGGPRTEAPA